MRAHRFGFVFPSSAAVNDTVIVPMPNFTAGLIFLGWHGASTAESSHPYADYTVDSRAGFGVAWGTTTSTQFAFAFWEDDASDPTSTSRGRSLTDCVFTVAGDAQESALRLTGISATALTFTVQDTIPTDLYVMGIAFESWAGAEFEYSERTGQSVSGNFTIPLSITDASFFLFVSLMNTTAPSTGLAQASLCIGWAKASDATKQGYWFGMSEDAQANSDTFSASHLGTECLVTSINGVGTIAGRYAFVSWNAGTGDLTMNCTEQPAVSGEDYVVLAIGGSSTLPSFDLGELTLSSSAGVDETTTAGFRIAGGLMTSRAAAENAVNASGSNLEFVLGMFDRLGNDHGGIVSSARAFPALTTGIRVGQGSYVTGLLVTNMTQNAKYSLSAISDTAWTLDSEDAVGINNTHCVAPCLGPRTIIYGTGGIRKASAMFASPAAWLQGASGRLKQVATGTAVEPTGYGIRHHP